MNLTIWGAAQQVTGSMHLLQLKDYKILIDCGLDYEKGVHQERNNFFPFNPKDIDLVILTHAHIDHSGNLPTLVKTGYHGQILCTGPTADLTAILLTDSVEIFLRKLRKPKGRRSAHRQSVPQPLYLYKHVIETTDRFVTIAFEKPFKVNNDIEVTFYPAGHLLGAASVVLTITENGETKKIAFTGDVGRKNYPVLVDPAPLPPVDYLVCESTYGGRLHTKDASLTDTLIEAINDTCIKNPGRLIIPAFSIGRTQSLIFTLNKIFTDKFVPNVQVFVDSPLATAATEIYRKYQHYVSDEAKAFYQAKGDEFDFDNLAYLETQRESVAVSNYLDPCIIISSAGMLEGGRIQDHLYDNIQNYYCTILFIGYCAKGTLGDKLLRGDSFIQLRNRELAVYAKIKKTDLLSGHGDQNDLLALVTNQDVNSLKKVFLVHGDVISMEKFAEILAVEGYDVEIPEKGVMYEL